MPPRALAVLGFVLATSLAGSAIAQPDGEAEAKRLSQQATGEYKVGDFAAALADYQAAYQLFKAPQFLFNIAQCNFQLHNWDQAVFFFEGYLRELPDAGNRALVEDLMREARERRATDEAATKKQLDLEKERIELAKREEERAARERERTLAGAPPPARPVYKKWWFWTGVGAVVAGAAVTAVVLTSGDRTVLPEGSLGTWDRR